MAGTVKVYLKNQSRCWYMKSRPKVTVLDKILTPKCHEVVTFEVQKGEMIPLRVRKWFQRIECSILANHNTTILLANTWYGALRIEASDQSLTITQYRRFGDVLNGLIAYMPLIVIFVVAALSRVLHL